MPFTDSIFILIIVLIAVGLLDTALLALFVPFYMRVGIPAWWQSASIPTEEQFRQAITQMDGTELRGTWYPTIVFRRISPTELAFRHKLGEFKVGFRFRSPIRGIVRLVEGQYTVKVTNYLPWSTPVALALFIWLFRSFAWPGFEAGIKMGFFAFLLLIMGITVGVQLVVFGQVNSRILEKIMGKSYWQ